MLLENSLRKEHLMTGVKFIRTSVLIFYFLAVVISCTKGVSSSTAESTSQTGPAWTPASTCSTRVLDYGQKGTVAAVARGSYSDVQMIPGTSSPSIAYIDAGSATLKFNYWTGTSFQTEVISGDGTGAFVRLSYLSTGIPIVLWTLGGNVKVAIRSAAPPALGIWVAGVIDSATAPRSIEVSINPLDQVAVTYISDTAVAGRVKFLYCDAPCSSPTNFQSMVATPYIENTNVVAAEVATGVGWCKSSSTLYYPAVVYSVTGLTRFAICQNATLSNCLTNTNWTPQTVVATGNLSSKLLLDSTITGDVPKVISKGAAGMVTYTMGAACTAAPAAFTAGATLGGANSGTQWIKVLKDSGGKFHVAANESTTSVNYYNSQTTTFNGAWNASSVIETITTPAATAGGAALDPANTTMYVSYGTNAAPFDLRLGRVINYATASNSATYVRYTPDVTGLLQMPTATAQLGLISTAKTSTGLPAIAYVDYSIGAVAGAKLKYAYRVDASSDSAWTTAVIPGTQSPQFPALIFDQNNLPWIGYFDAANNRFYLAANSRPDGSGIWNTFEFPSQPTGAPAALPAANQVALSLANNSGVITPVMITIDNNATSRSVKSALFNPATLTWSTATTIETLTVSGASHISADYDSSGNIVLAYRDNFATKAKYTYSSNGVTWTAPLLVGSIGQGAGVTVKINSVTSSPAMSYFDRLNNSVYYAACTGTFSSCASSGWSANQIATAAGVSGLVLGNEQLLKASLSFSATGVAQIAHPTGQGSYGSLFLADNNSGVFSTTQISSGSAANLSGSPALNFAVSGWNVATVRNAIDQLVMAFIGPGNWLYVSSCGD
ncbi:MAG: hypothetical protein AABY64_03685 [Bdellovibrionota bacterium]